MAESDHRGHPGGIRDLLEPVVYDDDPSDALAPMVIFGVSGGAAELGSEEDRYAFHGSIMVVDSATGAIVKKIWTIPEAVWEQGYAGGAVWAPTPAIDTTTNYAYAATGNPFQPEVQHPNTDAIVKFDLDRSRSTFGTIVDSYQGNVDEYFTQFADQPCVKGRPRTRIRRGWDRASIWTSISAPRSTCSATAAARSWAPVRSRGVYHTAFADTMDPSWNALVGNPGAVGGVVGSAAYDGSSITGPITPVGVLLSLNASDGGYRWFAPVVDALHYGQPVSSANGLVYTVDLKGFLDIYDAATGLPLMQRPMGLGGSNSAMPSLGGVSIARNTVYASVGTGGGTDGGVVAFRPGGGGGGGGGGPEPPGLPGLSGGGLIVVAVPGSALTTYGTPVMLVQAGAEMLSFLNLDAAPHDVRSNDGLFTSQVVGLGGNAPVVFNTHLESGQSYGFYCSLHPGMTGTLLAV